MAGGLESSKPVHSKFRSNEQSHLYAMVLKDYDESSITKAMTVTTSSSFFGCLKRET